jgi:uncharacterized glyoxalase superfamily protein PhnB
MSQPVQSQQPLQHPPRPEGWEREIYPMPSFPMLMASDVDRSSTWYQDVFGFVDVFTFRDGKGSAVLAHLRWCKYADILIGRPRAPMDGERGAGITLVFADNDVDARADQARKGGATIVEGPADTPWHTRDLTVLDPDGYRIRFTAPQATVMHGDGKAIFDQLVTRVSKT